MPHRSAIVRTLLPRGAAADCPELACHAGERDPDRPRDVLFQELRHAWRHLCDCQARLAEAIRMMDAAVASRRDSAGDAEAYVEEAQWEAICNVVGMAEMRAEHQLIETVLAAHGRVSNRLDLSDLGDGWAPVIVEVEGAFLVVAPNNNGSMLKVVNIDDFIADWGDA